MNPFARLTLLAAFAAPLAAQAPMPGSVLIFPSIRNNAFATTFVSVSNTNLSPLFPFPGTQHPPDVLAYFNYVIATPNPNDRYRPLACTHFCRPELMTAADEITVSVGCHSPGDTRGYLVVSAHSAIAGGPVSHNFLAGSAAIFDYVANAVYVYPAIPFCSPLTVGLPTDVNPPNGRLDFNGIEYEMMHDHLIVDSFIAAFNSRLVLADFSCLPGDNAEVSVDLSIFNDNEFPLSLHFGFRCWMEIELHDISTLFFNGWLQGISNDPAELDINCDGLGDFEAGWFSIYTTQASIAGGAQVQPNPAILGAMLGGARSCSDSRIIWGSKERRVGCF
ncbi:MAG: hypothetical protein KDB80_06710 [Planctomycetes bacterium]|nr:hypothetical protein [Planctomycetota bacterium]